MSKQKKRKIEFGKLLKNKKLLLIIFVVLLLFVAVCVWLCVSSNKSDTIANDSDTKNISSKVDSIVTKDGAKAGQDYLDSELKKTSNKKKQSGIYAEKAILVGSFVGGDDNKKALEYAYKSNELYQSKTTAYLIAFYEEKLGNITIAVKYYKIYISRLSPTIDQQDIDYYTAYVKKLEINGNING